MADFKAMRINQSYSYAVAYRPQAIYPLLCPVREYEWIDGWKCEMVYTQSGYAEKNAIFKTNFPNEGEEIWVVSRYEKDRSIGFVRTAADGSRSILFEITLKEENGKTTLNWCQTMTGLTPAGNAFVSSQAPELYKLMMSYLERMLKHYLDTGRMLRLSENDMSTLARSK